MLRIYLKNTLKLKKNNIVLNELKGNILFATYINNKI